MADATQTWTPLPLVKKTAAYLAEKGVPGARLDAEVLLASVLGLTRISLYAASERVLTEAEVDAYRAMVRRRANREPVGRILGCREFMGLEFRVTPEVLSPRPETEILVEQALRILCPERKGLPRAGAPTRMRPLGGFPEGVAEPDAPVYAAGPGRTVLDIGTGSGCIAVSVAVLAPGVEVVAGDISAAALNVARENAARHGVDGRIAFREGDLFSVCEPDETFDVIVSNPPYLVEGDEGIWPEVARYDPALALYGGADGLTVYRALAGSVERHLRPGGALLLEVGAGQAEAVTGILRDSTLLTGLETVPDHAGIDRVVMARMALPE